MEGRHDALVNLELEGGFLDDVVLVLFFCVILDFFHLFPGAGVG